MEWDEFVKDGLLHCAFITGIHLISQHGTDIYSYGDLKDQKREDNEEILKAFRAIGLSQTETICNKGLTVKINKLDQHFKIYYHTFKSIYAQSGKGNGGLVVSCLPYGVLICHYADNCVAGEVIKTVEAFCDKLRT